MPKWFPFVQYLGELHRITKMYQAHKNVLSADVQTQPGRLIIYWIFPKSNAQAQTAREFMEAVFNINVSYLEIFKVIGITVYEQTLTYTSFLLRVDLLVPHHFPELVKFRQSPVPWDLPHLIAALDRVAIDRKDPW